jgi:hypothetical protein
MFEYFYNEILRKTIIAFGSLFNEIKIAKVDESNNTKSITKVPLAYGPMQKFLARLEQSPDLNKPVQLTLPRMSFEMTGISYDPGRKVTTAQSFLAQSKSDGKDIRKLYMPVPYNVTFELSIYTKINDDMLQIIEQILPYFQPQYSVTVDLVDQIGETRDIPVILDNISMSDEYEGDFTKRRALIYTLSFTAKTYIFGPTSTSASQDIIKKVSIGLVSGAETLQRRREVSYVVTPTATKSYSENDTTTTAKDVTVSDTRIEVSDSSLITEGSYITIGEETLKVTSKDSNLLKVTRGVYGTSPSEHVSGSGVKLITDEDNDLIEFGDNFGFDGDFV